MAIRRRDFFYFLVRCDDPNKIGCKNSTEKILGRVAAIEAAKRIGYVQKGNSWRCSSCDQESLQKARDLASKIWPSTQQVAV